VYQPAVSLFQYYSYLEIKNFTLRRVGAAKNYTASLVQSQQNPFEFLSPVPGKIMIGPEQGIAGDGSRVDHHLLPVSHIFKGYPLVLVPMNEPDMTPDL
jgi:hypothetical protein